VAVVAVLLVLTGSAADRTRSADAIDDSVFTVRIYPVSDLLTPAGSPSETAPAGPAGLIGVVRTVVRPASWGDPRASITARPAGHLTISQTAAGHAAVRRLFGALRLHRAIRITIRARFFTYHRRETLTLITSAMRLDRPGPARLILDPAAAGQLVAALAGQPDVKETQAPLLSVVSGGQAYVAIGTETILSTRWRLSEDAPQGLSEARMRLSAFEGNTLLVGATAGPDGTNVNLQVTAAATQLVGGRSVSDDLGRIDLPEFAASRASVTARVPSGHALLVSGLKTSVEEARDGEAAGPLPRRRAAEVLVVLTPTVQSPNQRTAGASRDSRLAIESMAALARMRRWAPTGRDATSRGRRPPAVGRVTLASPDGRVTLDLNLSEGDVRTPAVKEWLLRLLDRSGLRVETGNGTGVRDQGAGGRGQGSGVRGQGTGGRERENPSPAARRSAPSHSAPRSWPRGSRPRGGGDVATAPRTGPERLADQYLLRTYDVRDLLAVNTRHPATPLGVFEGVEPSVARGFRVVSGQALGSPTTQPAVAVRAPGAAMEAELLRLVREAVGDEAWGPRGRGRVVLYEGRLCVWQRPASHARVRALLRTMRRRAGTQLTVRVGVYACTDEAAERIRRNLRVKDLTPVAPLLRRQALAAPAVEGALLNPEQIVAAVRLLNRTAGSQAIFSGTVACLPVRAAALEDVRQVVFVSHLDRADVALTAEPGVASAGAVLRLEPVPSADLKQVQLGVSARIAHVAGIDRARPTAPGVITGPVHSPDLRTTALDMALVVPSGQGVLVMSGQPMTPGPPAGQPMTTSPPTGGPMTTSPPTGGLMCLFWPTVSAPPPGPADGEDLTALTEALDRPFGLALNDSTLAEAIQTLARTGVRVELRLTGAERDRTRFFKRRVTLVRRRTTLIEALGTLLGDRLERVELLPPDGVRLRVTAAEKTGDTDGRPVSPVFSDEPIGLLSVRSSDGRTVTRFPVRRRDLTPEVRARIEDLLSETFKNQGAGSPRQ